jgi:hypothetical protein
MDDKTINSNHALVIPTFKSLPALSLDMKNIREAESRFIEAKTVNPVTYSELESCFNEGYRDLRKYLSLIGFQITQAEKLIEDAKADVFLDKYPTYMDGKPKSHDTSDVRKAFLSRDPDYQAALDKFNQLKALESHFDGKIKVIENVCRYMRKKMDLILRSGLSSTDYYNTQGKSK